MERNFRINWSAIVEEARQRRKKLGFTQQRLAVLAGVSTPTLSNFENSDKAVLVDSALSIFSALGMIDKRELIFTEAASHNPHRKIVVFWGRDGNKHVRCEISHEALSDYFGLYSKTQDPSKAFELHKSAIEHEARRKYLANNLQQDGSVLIETQDL